MFDEEIGKGVLLVGILIAIIVGAIAIPSVWKAPDQIVQSSGDPQLQTSYQTGKEIINRASDFNDSSKLAKSVRNLGG